VLKSSFLYERIFNSALRRAARLYRSRPFVMRNTAPLVSFTFDDVPESAYTNGAAVLDSEGVRGTFYISGGTCDQVHPTLGWRHISRDQVRALNEGGHEIGCHTFSHPRVDQIDARALEDECARNRDLLRELCTGAEPTNFCYPFGRVSLPRKRQLERRFDSCRSVYKGINAGTVDLGLLKVIQLYDRTLTPDKLQGVLRENRDRNGWLIFYTHDVAERPTEIGCSPQVLRATVEAVKANGMPCLPIREALVAIGYSSAPH